MRISPTHLRQLELEQGEAELLRGRLRRLEEARINPAVRGRGGVVDLHPLFIPRGHTELEPLFGNLHRRR